MGCHLGCCQEESSPGVCSPRRGCHFNSCRRFHVHGARNQNESPAFLFSGPAHSSFFPSTACPWSRPCWIWTCSDRHKRKDTPSTLMCPRHSLRLPVAASAGYSWGYCRWWHPSDVGRRICVVGPGPPPSSSRLQTPTPSLCHPFSLQTEEELASHIFLHLAVSSQSASASAAHTTPFCCVRLF